MDDKVFTEEIEKHITEFEKNLPEDEEKLVQMQQEVEIFAHTVRRKVRILADLKKLYDKYSGQNMVTSTPWQEATVNCLMSVNETAVKVVHESVKECKGCEDTEYEQVMKYVLLLLKNNRVIRVKHGVYRWIGGTGLALPPAPSAAKKKAVKKKASKKKPRRKKVSWIQLAQRVMRKDPKTVWTNTALCVEIEAKTKETVTNKRMSNFIRRSNDAGLIKRVGRGEYQWIGK